MLEFLAASSWGNSNLFNCVVPDFFRRGWGGVRNFWSTRSGPSFGLGFGFFERWRRGLVVAYFAEIELLDGVDLAGGVASCKRADQKRTSEGSHTGGLYDKTSQHTIVGDIVMAIDWI